MAGGPEDTGRGGGDGPDGRKTTWESSWKRPCKPSTSPAVLTIAPRQAIANVLGRGDLLFVEFAVLIQVEPPLQTVPTFFAMWTGTFGGEHEEGV